MLTVICCACGHTIPVVRGTTRACTSCAPSPYPSVPATPPVFLAMEQYDALAETETGDGDPDDTELWIPGN